MHIVSPFCMSICCVFTLVCSSYLIRRTPDNKGQLKHQQKRGGGEEGLYDFHGYIMYR